MPDVVSDPSLAGFNSYSSLDDADLYLDGRLYSDEWILAEIPNKEASLIMATTTLNDYLIWNGFRTSQDQLLEWPRRSVTDREGYLLPDSTIPAALKFATIEMALFLLKEDRLADDTLGISRVKAGSLDVTFDKHDRKLAVPDPVMAKISFLGRQRKGKQTCVRLVRN